MEITQESLKTLGALAQALWECREEAAKWQKKYEEEESAHKDTCDAWSQKCDANEKLRAENEGIRAAICEATDSARVMRDERDEARMKLGKWARFVNFNVYERMNTFVLKGKTAKEQVKEMVDFFEEICQSLEQFQNECPITLIEEGRAK